MSKPANSSAKTLDRLNTRAGDYIFYKKDSQIHLTAKSGHPMPRGSFFVASISPVKTASTTAMPVATFSLYPAVYSHKVKAFVRQLPRVAVTLTAQQFRAAFGRRFPTASMPNGLLKKTLKELFIRAGRAKDFRDDIDYDKAFKGIAGKMFARFPGNLDEADKDDMILDTFLQAVTTKTIQAYDSTRDPVAYFGGMFQLRMTNELKDLVHHRVHEVQKYDNSDSEDMTDSEYLDLVDTRHRTNPTMDEVDFNDLTKGLLAYFKTKKESQYYTVMFNMLALGYSNKEVADKLGVSQAIISRYLDRMKQAILEYATKTDNDLLYQLMSEYLGKRKHALDVIDPLVDVLKQYKKRTSGRVPVGKTLTVSRTKIPNRSSVDYAASVALDSEQPDLSEDDLDEHFSDLMEEDELVDRDPNTIVGLKVLRSTARK